MIKAVLFDMDGTLLDSERVALKAWEYVIDKYNLDMDLTLPIESIGLNYNSMVKLFHDRCGKDFPFEKYWKCAKQFFAEYESTNGIDVKAGFFELSDYLKSVGIKMYVATSTYHDSAIRNLTRAGIWEHFDGAVGGDEITNGKPDPEIFLKAAELSGCEKEECIVVEDSENGVKSAVNAGIKCVFIKDIKDIDPHLKKRAFCECADLSGIIEVIKRLNSNNNY